jgi:sterol desaturase/sphingolipid hydroxylase (fatty acid hydroxylase superfamily)
MPTPIELLLDPVSLTILTLYAALMSWEMITPARSLPRVKYWKIRGLLSFTIFFYLSSYLPLLWDEHLARYQLFDLGHIGTVAGTIIGLLVIEAGIYTWHRLMHSSNILWRVFHQMHHSAERLDTFGAFWFSPMDMIGWTVLGSLCLTLFVGVNPQANTAILLLTTFFSMFQHANIRTPRWLGYLVQRPESHTIHHGKGIHRFNYSDLPIFDILLGTFRNPKGYETDTGFYPGASSRITDMLRFRDVSKPAHRIRDMRDHNESVLESAR